MHVTPILKTILTTTMAIMLLLWEVTWGQWHAITAEEVKEFSRYYAVLVIAIEEKNYDGFERFAPGFLDAYEFVLIDPESRTLGLRSRYRRIETVFQKVQTRKKADRLYTHIQEAKRQHRYKEALRLYVEYAMQQRKIHGDSCIAAMKPEVDSLMRKTIAQAKRGEKYSTYSLLLTHPLADDSTLQTLKMQLERQLHQEYARLTAQMSYHDICAFEEKYPGVYAQDIRSLKELALSQMRGSALKEARYKDDLSGVRRIKAMGISDEKVDDAYKKGLLRRIYRDSSIALIDEYCDAFVNDERIDMLTTLKQTIVRQNRMREALLHQRLYKMQQGIGYDVLEKMPPGMAHDVDGGVGPGNGPVYE